MGLVVFSPKLIRSPHEVDSWTLQESVTEQIFRLLSVYHSRVPYLLLFIPYVSNTTSTQVHDTAKWLKVDLQSTSARSRNVEALVSFPVAWTTATLSSSTQVGSVFVCLYITDFSRFVDYWHNVERCKCLRFFLGESGTKFLRGLRPKPVLEEASQQVLAPLLCTQKVIFDIWKSNIVNWGT